MALFLLHTLPHYQCYKKHLHYFIRSYIFFYLPHPSFLPIKGKNRTSMIPWWFLSVSYQRTLKSNTQLPVISSHLFLLGLICKIVFFRVSILFWVSHLSLALFTSRASGYWITHFLCIKKKTFSPKAQSACLSCPQGSFPSLL